MADKTFVSLVTRLNPSVPGCPQETVRQAIRDAAINVCERTLAWRYEIPKFNLQAGVYEYFFNTRSGTDVCGIFLATVNDNPLSPLNLDDAARLYPQWANLFSGEDIATVWSGSTNGNVLNNDTFNAETLNQHGEFEAPDAIVAEGSYPQAITQLTPEKFIILPLPDDQTYECRLIVALRPRRDATGMEEYIFRELEDVIVHRALQNLLILPNVPWSDRDLATYHAKQYQFHMNHARARANLGNNRGSMSVELRNW